MAALRGIHGGRVLTANATVSCPQCQDPTLPAVYEDWRRGLAAVLLVVHVSLLVAAGALRWWQRRSPLLRLRDRSLLVATFIGAAATMHMPLREVVGEARWPCIVQTVLGLLVSIAFIIPLVVRMCRLGALRLAQNRILRALSAEQGGGHGRGGAAGQHHSLLPPTTAVPRDSDTDNDDGEDDGDDEESAANNGVSPAGFAPSANYSTCAGDVALAASTSGGISGGASSAASADGGASGGTSGGDANGGDARRTPNSSRSPSRSARVHPAPGPVPVADSPPLATTTSGGIAVAAPVPAASTPPQRQVSAHFPRARKAWRRGMEWVALDVLRLHSVQAQRIILLVLEVPLALYVFPRLAAISWDLTLVGCPFTDSENAGSAAVYLAMLVALLATAPAHWHRGDVYYHRDEFFVILGTTAALAPIYVVPRFLGRPIDDTLGAVLPPARVMMLVAWAHLLAAHIVPAVLSIMQGRRLLAGSTDSTAVSPRLVEAAGAPVPLPLLVPALRAGPPLTREAGALQGAATWVAARASGRPPAGISLSPRGADAPAGAVTPSAGDSPASHLAIAAAHTHPHYRHEDVGLLQFLLACAVRERDGRPASPVATLRGALRSCQTAAGKPVAQVTAEDRRLLISLLASTAAGHKWLRPALRRELHAGALLFLNDCFVHRHLVTTATNAVMSVLPQLSHVTLTVAAPPPLRSISETRFRRQSSSNVTLALPLTTGAGTMTAAVAVLPCESHSPPTVPPLPGDGPATVGSMSPVALGLLSVSPPHSDVFSLPPPASRAGDTVTSPPPTRVVPPPVTRVPLSSNADVIRLVVVAQTALTEVHAHLGVMDFRYLHTFSPTRLAVHPTTAASLLDDVKAAKTTLSLLLAYSHISFRGVTSTELSSRLRDLRRVFDVPAGDALEDLAEGLMVRLLASTRAPQVLDAASDLAASILSGPLRVTIDTPVSV